jgi:hypothetical protein
MPCLQQGERQNFVENAKDGHKAKGNSRDDSRIGGRNLQQGCLDARRVKTLNKNGGLNVEVRYEKMASISISIFVKFQFVITLKMFQISL